MALGFCQDERYQNVSVDLPRLLKMVLTSLSAPIVCMILLVPNAFCTLSHFTLTTTLSGWFLSSVLGNLSKIKKPIGDRARI